MSADPVLFTQAESWKLTLPCTRIEAEQLAGEIPMLAELDPPPVLMTSEPDPARPEEWRLDAYFEAKPDDATVALIRSLVPSAKRRKPLIEKLAQEDWVAISQAGLEPIRAGRFFVHTPQQAADIPDDMIAFEIAAGRAFGTGHHETTSGCLMMLDRLKQHGARFDHIADIGTGTGLLAFAALALWPRAAVIASDIDPIAIDVSDENAEANAIAIGTGRGQVELAVAAGMAHRRIVARAPYDLVIANILAGPLIELAPAIATTIFPGGSLILAGLLDHQADRVARAYRRQGMRLAGRITLGDWPILHMVKRPRWRSSR